MASYFARKHCLPWSTTKQSRPARICLCKSNYVPHRSDAATRGAASGRAPPAGIGVSPRCKKAAFGRGIKELGKRWDGSQEIRHPHGCISWHQESHPRRDLLPQHHPGPESAPSRPCPHAAPRACNHTPGTSSPPNPYLPLSAHDLDAGQLIKSSFIFRSIYRARQGTMAPFSCTIFQPIIIIIIIIIIAVCFFPAEAAPQDPVTRTQVGVGCGGRAMEGAAGHEGARFCTVFRVPVKVPCPQPWSLFVAQSGITSRRLRCSARQKPGSRSSLPTAAPSSFACTSSAPASGSGFACRVLSGAAPRNLGTAPSAEGTFIAKRTASHRQTLLTQLLKLANKKFLPISQSIPRQ